MKTGHLYVNICKNFPDCTELCCLDTAFHSKPFNNVGQRVAPESVSRSNMSIFNLLWIKDALHGRHILNISSTNVLQSV